MGGMSAQAKPRGKAEADFWPEEGKDLPKGKILIGTLLALVLLIAGGIWFLMKQGDDGSEIPPGSHLPNVYVPQNPGQETAGLAQRSADIRPFTEGEVFGDYKEVAYRGYSFTLVKSEVGTNCVQATWGDLLQGALRRGECSQVARGAYLSKDKKYAGLFISINMADAKGAQQVLNSLDPALKGGFVRPLAMPGVKDFGSGFTAAYSQAVGHYVIMSWVGLASGAQPQAMNELIDSSLAVQKPEDFAWGRLVELDPQ